MSQQVYSSLNVYSVGDRIAQIVFMKLPEVELTEVEELSETKKKQINMEAQGSKKPAKIAVTFAEDGTITATLCEKESKGKDIYLAKGAIIQGLLELSNALIKRAERADANGLTKKIAKEQVNTVVQIINQINKF